ncbi:MAG: ATPase, T2SS/T4P/T4SS family [Candidatus Shapirobacteria bacterium]|nr:ATPase, T2SS/T4P/T4SS family [Candidatus Shapirobacteria bacterium]MDD5073791.1 ATPase, T2SS/T4P/T4SS family [Candidatus Shapirobacteria bacterium]MDD5481524.1 ATPase, T2SS/T4P/T4SS family [Candidatus Shapirobacteria bacterium]
MIGSSAPPGPSSNTKTNNGNNRSLSDVLLEKGLITEEKRNQIRLNAAREDKTEEQIVRERGVVDSKSLALAKAELFHVPFVSLAEIPISPEAISLVSQSIASTYKLIPLLYNRDGNEITIAMANPLDLEAIEFLERKIQVKVIPKMADEEEIALAIKEYYGGTLVAEVSQALDEELSVPKTKAIDIRQLGEVIREAPVAKVVTTILEFAVTSRASDIHIEPQEEKTRVRYRIDGIMHEKLLLPRTIHGALVSRIKILSGMRIDEKRLPQDGRFSITVDEEEVDLRVSSVPTTYGEKIVMRLLRSSGGVPDLPDLGLRGLGLKRFEEAITKPNGIIIVCGPTGSGKTTTLYSALSRINTSRVNILTIEDPVEYEIAGVAQVQVNREAGLTFASALRSFLRQDPDVMMVGEIRDPETTELAIQAALTGHLVFSTLHTNQASGAIPRLLDLGAETFLLASALSLVIGQRIARRICPNCQEKFIPEEAVLTEIRETLGPLMPKNKDKIELVRGTGCEKCNNTGYYGRIGIYEALPVSEKIAKLILEQAPAGEIEKQAVDEGMVTMLQDGYLRVLEGVTTIEEVVRVVRD